jgi:hypothetical protein
MVDRRKAAGVWYRTSESRRLREPHPCAVVVTGHDRSEVTSRLVLEAGDSAEPAAAQSDPTMARLVVITDMAESRATFRRVDSTSPPNCLGGLRPINGHRLATPFVPPLTLPWARQDPRLCDALCANRPSARSPFAPSCGQAHRR